MNAISGGNRDVFFLYGFSGTGKTLLWTILSAALKSKEYIVLNVASSRIIALLFPEGMTAHSRFAIPLNPDEFSMCNMKQGSNIVGFVSETSLIICDETPMMSRHCFETLDRNMRDILQRPDTPFGVKVVVFGGDFCEILHVIHKGSRVDIVMTSLNSSDLWDSCEILRLTKNMRLFGSNNNNDSQDRKEFSDYFLAIGDGRINEPNSKKL